MVKHINKKLFAVLSIMLSLSILFSLSYADTNDLMDLFIETDPISATYTGHEEGTAIIDNIRFADVGQSHWALEAISRMGALEIIKGYPSGNFGPNDTVSKEVVLTMIVRAVGMEADAITASDAIAAAALPEENIQDIWARGYMQVAFDLGLITQQELADALTADQTTLDPELNFMRQSEVTREQVAVWLIDAMEATSPGLMPPKYTLNEIYRYTDVDDISNAYGPYIESITSNQIMKGNNNLFNPQGNMTRAEMAQVMTNLDEILFEAMGYSRFTGTVGDIDDYEVQGQNTVTNRRDIRVRNQNGLVDLFQYVNEETLSGKENIQDTPVLKNDVVVGLKSLEVNDSIEYIVEDATNELKYVYSKGENAPTSVFGQLQPMVDPEQLEISVEIEDVIYTFKMIEGLYDANKDSVLMNQQWYPMEQIPVGSYVTLQLENNIVTGITVETTPTLSLEISGIVKSIDTAFNYITIIDWYGNEITKYYLDSEVVVEKQHYYDEEDEIGYIDELYPDYRFDERDTTIESLEPGDIVHLKLDFNNPLYVTAVSAKTNYIVKYGTVKEINYYGAEGAGIIVTLDNGGTAKYDIDDEVVIKKLEKNVSTASMQAGDTIRMLVNQAVLKPGTITETIKEIVIDAYGDMVMNVYRGQMGGLDRNQDKLSLIDCYTLTKTGWSIHDDGKQLSVDDEAEYYYNGEQVTVNYILNNLLTDDLEVYVATESYYGKEVIAKVSLRDGRDSALDYSNITYSNGFDTINLLSEASDIEVDPGTIVIKNDRLVEVGNIMSPDYAQVVLNGGYEAAIVHIEQEPNNDAIDIFRGRIATIDDDVSFEVHSHAALKGMEWVYSPIERIFNIDHRTMIIDTDVEITLDEFIDYSDISKVDEVYTIIADGDYASYIVDNPYAKEGVSGEIYEVDSTLIMIKDVMVYDSEDRLWSELSYTNSYAQVDLALNTVIVKNSEVVSYDDLEIGDQITVMTTEDLQEKLQLTDERNVPGYIILVER